MILEEQIRQTENAVLLADEQQQRDGEQVTQGAHAGRPLGLGKSSDRQANAQRAEGGDRQGQPEEERSEYGHLVNCRQQQGEGHADHRIEEELGTEDFQGRCRRQRLGEQHAALPLLAAQRRQQVHADEEEREHDQDHGEQRADAAHPASAVEL